MQVAKPGTASFDNFSLDPSSQFGHFWHPAPPQKTKKQKPKME